MEEYLWITHLRYKSKVVIYKLMSTYFVKQPGTEDDLNEVVHDKSILKLEWFSVLHKPRADNLSG